MRASAIVCAVLAGTLGFSTLASARDHGRRDDGPRAERRDDRREARREQRAERREDQRERRQRHAQRHDRQEDRAFRQGYRAGVQQQPTYVYRQPIYQVQQPRHHHYQQPRHYQAPRFQRGAYMPYEYRQNHYYVNDWRSHRGLYAPPHGHQWMQVGTEFVLVALATGLIVNLLMN